jgi:hypothetical protein
MPGQGGIWLEHRTNLPLFRQRSPSNTISEFVMNSNAILCHKVSGGPPCIVVPESLKAFVFRHHHGIPLSGHKGRRKVIQSIRVRYWWKGMNRDVNRWVRSCLVCPKRKTRDPRMRVMHVPIRLLPTLGTQHLSTWLTAEHHGSR